MREPTFESREAQDAYWKRVAENPTPREADEIHQELMWEHLGDVAATEDETLPANEMQEQFADVAISEKKVTDYVADHSDKLLVAARSDKAQHYLEQSNPEHTDIISEHESLVFEYVQLVEGQLHTTRSLPRYVAEIERISAPGENQDLSRAAYYQEQYEQELKKLEEYPNDLKEALAALQSYVKQHPNEIYSDALIEAALDGIQINHPDAINVSKS